MSVTTIRSNNVDIQALLLHIHNILGLNNSGLVELVIRNCLVETIYANTFSSFKNLNILDLSRNIIEIIEEGAFNGLDMLHTIDLSNNRQLKSMSPIVFRNIPELLLLNVEGCFDVQEGEELDDETALLYIEAIKNISVRCFIDFTRDGESERTTNEIFVKRIQPSRKRRRVDESRGGKRKSRRRVSHKSVLSRKRNRF